MNLQVRVVGEHQKKTQAERLLLLAVGSLACWLRLFNGSLESVGVSASCDGKKYRTALNPKP